MTQHELAMVQVEYDAEIAAYLNGNDRIECHAALNARALLTANAAALGVAS